MIVGVIGSGSIGPDLAYGFLSAMAGNKNAKVYLVDIKQEALDKGTERILGYVKKGLSRGKLSSKAAASIRSMLTPTLSVKDLASCEYVLEAASENLDIKKAILKNLEATVSKDCLVGFATSGLPRKYIAEDAKHPDRCFVNHPFFPAWRALPVEVVLSGNKIYGDKMMATLKRLGKVPIVTSDVECFAADDIFCNYVSEAARIVEEGVANPAQVDKIVNDAIGGGGPLNVMDATQGNLLTVHCQELMQNAETGSDWFKAPEILSKVGNGSWHDRKKPMKSDYDETLKSRVLDRILAVLFGRTFFVLDNRICEAADLDWMTKMALGFKKGLLSIAEEMGMDKVKSLCETFAAKNPGFHVSESVKNASLKPFLRNVRVEIDDGIAVVRVWRPEVKNALSALTISEISSAITKLGDDDSIKGVVFSSYDGSLAGADINELAALPTPKECEALCNNTHPLMLKLSQLKKPLVAAVDGPVLGGGAEFSMACHARVVGKNLMLGQPEVNLGIIPGYGGTQRLPRLIGVEKALKLMRTSQVVGAKDACAWGWATGEPSDNPVADAKNLIADHLSGKTKLTPVSPEPIQDLGALTPSNIEHRSLVIDNILVDVVKRGLAMPLEKGLALEAEGFGRCKKTVDMDIGMKNFMQNGPRVPAQFLHE